MFVSLYGEVQKQIIHTTLLSDFGLEVDFLPSTVICVERLLGTAEAVETMYRDGNPFFATLRLRVEPDRDGAGNSFVLDVNTGVMPTGFYRAAEEATHQALQQGVHDGRSLIAA